MSEVNESIETTVESEAVDTASTTSEPSASEDIVTYTQEELDAQIARAITNAQSKWSQKQTKSNTELTNELNELKAQLARKDNEAYVSNEINSRGIPAELTALFYGEDEDSSKAKLNMFTKWYKEAIQAEVDKRLSSTKAPQLSTNAPGVSSSVKPLGSFQDFLSRK